MRPMSSTCRNCWKPAPRGAEQVLLRHAAVGEASAGACRTRSSPSCGTARPARSRACRSATIRFEISSSPVRAVMQTTPEMSVPALVMNCLAPSITHSPPSRRRARARVAGIGARLGLGQPERAEALAGAQPRQPLPLLLLGAEQVDRLRAERGVRAQRDRDRGVDARQLLDRERVGERVGAAAAVLLGERDAHQAQLAELAHDLVREAPSSRSSSSATGATSAWAKSRTVRWSSAWSSERSKSMALAIIPNDRSNFE